MTDQPGFTDLHYAAIGRVAVAAGRREHALAMVVQDLIDPDPEISQRVLSGMRFEQLLGLGRDLVAKRAPDQAVTDQFNEIASAAESAMCQRNQLLHGQWYFATIDDQPPQLALRTRTRKGPVTVRMFASL